jgi:uncharacterized protein YaiI (UPF0178 family)
LSTTKSIKLYIDGDALPNMLKPILLKAINKLSIPTIVVSNKKISIGKSNFVEYIIVDAGADVADNHIVELVKAKDLVITADIPLADKVITKNAHAIDHRGKLFTEDNIKQYLAIRDLMQNIRDMGETTKGPAPFSTKDAQKFANSLNSFIQNSF